MDKKAMSESNNGTSDEKRVANKMLRLLILFVNLTGYSDIPSNMLDVCDDISGETGI